MKVDYDMLLQELGNRIVNMHKEKYDTKVYKQNAYYKGTFVLSIIEEADETVLTSYTATYEDDLQVAYKKVYNEIVHDMIKSFI